MAATQKVEQPMPSHPVEPRSRCIGTGTAKLSPVLERCGESLGEQVNSHLWLIGAPHQERQKLARMAVVQAHKIVSI
jgi:hypothetical protein